MIRLLLLLAACGGDPVATDAPELGSVTTKATLADAFAVALSRLELSIERRGK